MSTTPVCLLREHVRASNLRRLAGKSHWKPGSRFYGNTKRGEHLTAKCAIWREPVSYLRQLLTQAAFDPQLAVG
jgi:hypothetical protein